MTLDDLRELVGAECMRLLKLGTVANIADELASRGMRGEKGSQCECPLARGICDTLLISTGRIQVDNYGVWWRTGSRVGQYAGVQPPRREQLVAFKESFALFRSFVEDFDGGYLPFLEAE